MNKGLIINYNDKIEKSLNEKFTSRLSVIFALKKEVYKLAQGDVVEIDGVMYRELEDGTIEEIVDAPVENVVDSEPESFTVDAYNITFTVGEEYPNWFGLYRVVNINANKGTMDVEYVESYQPTVSVGTKKTYPMVAQAQTITKAIKSKEIQMKLDNVRDLEGNEDAFSMGFIAANGYLSAEIGPKHHLKFPEKYKQLTGEEAAQYEGSGLRYSPNKKRWSYTLRVHLPSMSDELIGQLKFKNPKIRDSGIEVNDNAFVWGLFKKGFSIGKNKHNIDRILSSLSNEEKEAFRAGVQALQ